MTHFFQKLIWKNINLSQNIQAFLLMSRRRKALSTNLKYMKRTINVKVFSDLFQASSSPRKNYVFFVVETFVDFRSMDNYF